MMVRTFRAALIGALLILFIVFAAISSKGAYAPSQVLSEIAPGGQLDFKKAADYWQARIQRADIDDVRAEMVSVGNLLDEQNAHLLAHSFGEALFREKGIDGLEYCDAHFLYGCYDQLVGTLVSTYGFDALKDIGNVCGTRKPDGTIIGCKHSTGHGLVGYLGYSLADLKQALTECDVVGGATHDNFCSDGAFMEYNLRGMVSLQDDSKDSQARPYTDASRYEPCTQLPHVYLQACMHELPHWWFLSLQGEDHVDATVRQIGLNCDGLSSTEAKYCYQGIGFYLPQYVDFDVAKVHALCEAMPGMAAETLECLSSAANRIHLERGTPNVQTCGAFGLEDSARAYCAAFSQHDYAGVPLE